MTVALQPVASDPWWERFFDEDFAALWLHDDDPAEQRRRTEGLLRVLELGAGQWLFDQCCGVGRVAVPLVARGVNLLAVDSAAAYVDRARARCEALPPATRGSFHIALGDAFTYAPTRLCDAAINWYTSFGYVHDDTRNLRMLRAAYGALQPLGRFALDYPDMERVRAEFRPLTERRRETADGTFVALREARLDETRQMLVDRWTFTSPHGETRVAAGETRLFSREQLRELLARAGFEVLREVAPDEVGYAPDAGRCIWLARRPAHEGGRAG
ncbi:MAG: class I SAM-dependent methyltransferase [Myxococcales bacterium]|nr:class I SAM-dependent methyltransferase [Myxococcales bacterium]MCB9628504.1 class I SAM-dependent methyltransferase [Sandaracinaceae bacterium]